MHVTRAYINNADKTIVEYYRLSDFYHPSEGQKNGEPLFVTVRTHLAI